MNKRHGGFIVKDCFKCCQKATVMRLSKGVESINLREVVWANRADGKGYSPRGRKKPRTRAGTRGRAQTEY